MTREEAICAIKGWNFLNEKEREAIETLISSKLKKDDRELIDNEELWKQIRYSVEFKQFFERNFSHLNEVKVIPQSVLYKIIAHYFPKNNITEENLPEGWLFIEDKESLEQYRKTHIAGDSYCRPDFYKFVKRI